MQVERWARKLSVAMLCAALGALLGCGAPGETDGGDEEVGELEQELTEISNCKGSARCSVGRRKAILDTHGTGVLTDVLTNTGRRDLTQEEVHGLGQSYLSGCKKDFCSLYWVGQYGGAYANVSRSDLQIWSSGKMAWVPLGDHSVRRLGGPPKAGHAVERRLIASNELENLWHPTHGGKGYAPLTGYSCTDAGDGCHYVTAADAPPNTPQGGKGYVAGIYKSGKQFFSMKHRVWVDAFWDDDPNTPASRKPGKAEWVYGYIPTAHGRVYAWVIRSVKIKEQDGSWTVHRGYVRKP